MPQEKRKPQSYEHTVITKGDTRYDPPSLDTLGKQFNLSEWLNFCRQHRGAWRGNP